MFNFKLFLAIAILTMFQLIAFSSTSTPIKKVFLKEGQIYLDSGNGQELIQVTNNGDEKYSPSLEPFAQDKIIYHGKIERDSEPSSFLTVIDLEGKTIKKIPFNRMAREIKNIDWLPSGLLGIESWGRGRSSEYSIMEYDTGTIISVFWGNNFSLSGDRTKILFSQGIPGGYIPNPEFETLVVMLGDVTKLQKHDIDKAIFNNDAEIIYSTKGMLENKNIYELESDYFWNPDNEGFAFIDKYGNNKYLIVINIKDEKQFETQKYLLDAKVNKVKEITWGTQKNTICITDQITTWNISLTKN